MMHFMLCDLVNLTFEPWHGQPYVDFGLSRPSSS